MVAGAFHFCFICENGARRDNKSVKRRKKRKEMARVDLESKMLGCIRFSDMDGLDQLHS